MLCLKLKEKHSREIILANALSNAKNFLFSEWLSISKGKKLINLGYEAILMEIWFERNGI